MLPITRTFAAPLTIMAVLMFAPRAEALPVFARKYGTSCQTCHAVYPKLNAFGEAFRRTGYRWPAGEEEDAVVHEPVPLGQEAHKKVFPNAVWPGTLPANVPLSVQAASWITVAPDGDRKLGFDRVGGNLGINFAGSFGDTFSAWAGGGFSTDGETVEAEIERVFTVVQFLDEPSLNLRVGRIEPGASAVTMHRTLGPAPWMLTSRVGDNTFAQEPTQMGIELTGVTGAGRLGYAVGVVEGTGELTSSAKDFYGRLSYKIAGMRLDGVGGATVSEPWRDPSIQIGAFGWYGQAEVGETGVATQTDRYWIAGGDVQATWWDLSLVAAFTWQENTRPMLADPADKGTSYHLFAQLDYMALPWLMPSFRYEQRSILDTTGDRMIGAIWFLAQANIRTQVLVTVERVSSGEFEVTGIQAGLNTAF